MMSAEIVTATMNSSREVVKGKTPTTNPMKAQTNFTEARSIMGQKLGLRTAHEYFAPTLLDSNFSGMSLKRLIFKSQSTHCKIREAPPPQKTTVLLGSIGPNVGGWVG